MRAGDVIDGKYRVEVPLGEGGMGKVFAASHQMLGSTVAIKILRSEALASPEVPKRFMREAQAASRLRSEHVVRVTDVGALATGEPFMVMEMLHGHDLATRLKVGPLPAPQAVEYIVQACEGLAEAHGLGMVHRDIKPANLFVTARPNGAALIKVLDFGIATAATGDLDPRLTTTQSVMGSPSYMSPEQLKGARDVDARSDIWSIGVTLYELLSGQQPFVGPTLTSLSLSIVTDPYPKLIGISPELAAVLDRCLQKNPADRYQNVAELTRALAPMFTGGFVAADLVAGSYKMPVPPTLLGLENLGSLGTQPTIAPGGSAIRSMGMSYQASPQMTSTTSHAAGETGTHMPTQGRKWVWITAAVATIALGVGVGVMVGMSGGKNTEANAAQPPATEVKPPPAVAQPPAPPPEVKKDPEPVKEVVVEPPKIEPEVTAKKPEKTVKKPPYIKRPPTFPDRRPPDEKKKPPGDISKPPKDLTTTNPPPKDPPPKDPPPKDPPPKKCAPNDPRCGL